MDSGPALQSLINFTHNHICLPGDLGIAVFHQELFDYNLSEIFKAQNMVHVQYSYVEIFERILQHTPTAKESKADLLNLLTTCKLQPKLYFDNNAFAENLYEETLFADLMVCTTRTAEKLMTLQAKIPQLNCPTLVIPDNAADIKNILLVFNGNPASMKAIKDFTYMLPHLYAQRNVTLISTAYNHSREQTEDKLLMQYAKLHIPNVGFMKIIGNDAAHILDITRKNPDTLLVLGAEMPKGIENGVETIEHFKTDWENMPVFIA